MLFGGDFRFFWPENIGDFAILPSAWDSTLNTGLGIPALNSLWITSYFNFTALFSKLGLSWDLISLIFWILPSIILSFFSAYYLFKTLFKFKAQYSILAGIIYTLNTYFLMIFTGGQMGVVLAYSLAPLVLLGFVRVIGDVRFVRAVGAGLVLGLQVLFDPRLAFITLLAVGLYWLFFRKNIIFVFVVPALVAMLLHSYWLLPLLLTQATVVPEDFKSLSGFEFFSFADFSHALSLLHPNWPENIFGKVYFLQPEFLLLPIIAFSSLLFINNRTIKQSNNRHILFFALLGLLGVFLAKGANPPFGEVNKWLFQYLPGMNMFRDATKFYLLVALSYSVLIPFSVYSLTTWVISNFKFKIYYVFLLFTILYLLFLIRPLWMGELKNKFRPREIPQEYVQLKDFLAGQPQFFRTLWVPEWQRFGYFSNNHPAVGRYELLKSTTPLGQVEEINKEKTMELLQDLGIKYLIIPYDSEGEIFLEDRKYSEQEYQDTIEQLKMVTWLKSLDGFGKIAMFEVPDVKDRFWIEGKGEVLSWKMEHPTRYQVDLKIADSTSTLVFSESFDPGWQLKIGEEKMLSIKTDNDLNSFVITKGGIYTATVKYLPQESVYWGLFVSTITFTLSIYFLLKPKPGK